MKVLFTADLHIKLGQKNVPEEWAFNRYIALFKQLYKIIHSNKVELVVIGGDIFDKTPSIDELEVYWMMLASLPAKTIIYAGNHEANKKNTTFFTKLKAISNVANPLVEVIDDYLTIDNMDFIPYNKLKEDWPSTLQGNVLFTHVRGEIPPHVKPEIDLNKLAKWKLVLAGDLHSYSNSQLNILYPGSPITTSFHRELVSTGVIIFDSSTLHHTWVGLELPQLLKKTIKAGDPVVPSDYHHTIYEVEGSMVDLSTMQDNTLIAKKIAVRESDTALILDPKLSFEQEMQEYWQFILGLSDEEIKEVMMEWKKYAGNNMDTK